MLVAADIGGTNARFAWFRRADDDLVFERADSLATTHFADPVDLVAAFVADQGVEGLALAVAGPVLDGVAHGSNLPWDVAATTLGERFDCPVHLANDLEAIARYVPAARSDELVPLQEGVPVPHGPIGVIAPGTGMGQAMLLDNGNGRLRAYPSEAGHIDFAANDELQDSWLCHLRQRHGHVSLERACSGSALPVLYDFLAGDDTAAPDPDVAARIAAAADAAPLIVEAALNRSCPVCALALGTFIDILGAAAGNLGLQIVATGGVVLAGGIPPRILPALRAPRFLHAFNAKGRFAELTRRLPVRVLLTDDAGVRGAAHIYADRASL